MIKDFFIIKMNKFEDILRNIFRDSHTIPWNCPKKSFQSLFLQTLRYRFAGFRIAITHNEKNYYSIKICMLDKDVSLLGMDPV